MDCRVVMVRGAVGVPIDTLIMLGTRSKYVHTALLFEENSQQFIIEISAQDGLRQQSWAEYSYRGGSDLYEVVGMTPEKASEALDWVLGPDGPFKNDAGYDYSLIIGIIALIIDCCLPKKYQGMNPFDSSGNYICSELVQTALEKADFDFPGPTGFSTPQSIVDSDLLRLVT